MKGLPVHTTTQQTEEGLRALPLTRADLLRFFTDSFHPRSDWKMGVEYELSGVRGLELAPMEFFGEHNIEGMMAFFREFFGETAIATYEAGFNFGLKLPFGNITLEPGGQVEFSSAPFASVKEISESIEQFSAALSQFADKHGLRFYAAGVNPFNPLDEMPWSPKFRYKIMKEYLIKQGHLAHHMMRQTMSLQFNIDFSDEVDALRKYHAAIKLYAPLQRLSSNSQVYEGKVLESPMRPKIWEFTDPDRSGLPPVLTSFEDYVEYALDVPMFFLARGEELKPMSKRTTFRDFLAHGAEGEVATYADWELHLSTLFPEVRFKKNALELRMFDGNKSDMVEAFAAVVKGVFYNDTALDAVLAQEWSNSWESCKALLALAKTALEEEEQTYLAPLEEIVQKQKTRGDEKAELFTDSGLDKEALLKHLQVIPA